MNKSSLDPRDTEFLREFPKLDLIMMEGSTNSLGIQWNILWHLRLVFDILCMSLFIGMMWEIQRDNILQKDSVRGKYN